MNNLGYIRAETDPPPRGELLPNDIIENTLKCWIRAFLNAILIEEVLYRKLVLKNSLTLIILEFGKEPIISL